MLFNDDDHEDDHDTVIDGAADAFFYIAMFLAIMWFGNYLDGLLT